MSGDRAVRSVLLVLIAWLGSSCVPHGSRGGSTGSSEGTCHGACDHYLGCKGDERAESRETCLADCREIFVSDGTPDRASLNEFEMLECEKAVAFVDGDGGSGGANAEAADLGSHSQAR